MSDPSPESSAKLPVQGQAWIYTFCVTLVALLPRLFVALAWAREPVWDGHYYHFGAERIAGGFGYTEDVEVAGQILAKPWVHYPVGYSGFLAPFYAVFGAKLWIAPVLNALLGAALVLVVHRLARYYVGERRSQIAAAIAALHPGLIVYSTVVMSEPLAALLLMSAFWAALAYRGKWKALCLSGALVGLAALVRPASLLCAPLILFTLTGAWYSVLARSAATLGIALFVVLPWTARNCMVMDGCALVSTNGGWNLAIGALTETGRFRTLRARDGCAVVTGQVQQDRCWAEVGTRIILEDPLAWVARAPRKLAETYNHESFAAGYLREADPSRWSSAASERLRLLMTTFHRLLLFVAALCVVSLPRRQAASRTAQWSQGGLVVCLAGLFAYMLAIVEPPFYWFALIAPLLGVVKLSGSPHQGAVGRLLLAFWAATSLTHAVFFGEDRYHLVVTPALCVLAAGALRRGPRLPLAPTRRPPAVAG